VHLRRGHHHERRGRAGRAAERQEAGHGRPKDGTAAVERQRRVQTRGRGTEKAEPASVRGSAPAVEVASSWPLPLFDDIARVAFFAAVLIVRDRCSFILAILYKEHNKWR
jgi:hypothetical protein